MEGTVFGDKYFLSEGVVRAGERCSPTRIFPPMESFVLRNVFGDKNLLSEGALVLGNVFGVTRKRLGWTNAAAEHTTVVGSEY